MQVVLCWKVQTQSKEETHRLLGARTETWSSLSPATRNQHTTVTKSSAICEILESVLGTWEPNTSLTWANCVASTTGKDSGGSFIHHATVQAFFIIDLPNGITMKMPLLTSTQKIMSFTVPGPISEESELSYAVLLVSSYSNLRNPYCNFKAASPRIQSSLRTTQTTSCLSTAIYSYKFKAAKAGTATKGSSLPLQTQWCICCYPHIFLFSAPCGWNSKWDELTQGKTFWG